MGLDKDGSSPSLLLFSSSTIGIVDKISIGIVDKISSDKDLSELVR